MPKDRSISNTDHKNRWLEGSVIFLLGSGLLMTIVVTLKSIGYHSLLMWQLGQWFWPMMVMAVVSLILQILAFVRRFKRWRQKKKGACSLAPFRYLFCLVILFSVFKIAFVNLYSHTVIFLVYTQAFLVWSIYLLLEERLQPLISRKGFRIFDFVLFNICFLLPLSEATLRIMSKARPHPIFAVSSATSRNLMDNNRMTPGDFRHGFPINDHGYYDIPYEKEKNGKLRILSLSDSFGVGIVHHHYNFLTVCERNLPGCEVFNIAIPAIGPDEYLLLMKTECHEWDPDLYIVNLFVGNDLTDNYTSEWERGILCSWLVRDENMLFTVVDRVIKILESSPPPMNESEKGTHESLSAKEAVQNFPWMRDPLLEKPCFKKEVFFEIEYDRAIRICVHDKSRYTGFFHVLEELVESAGDVPIYFVIIPDEFQVEDWVWEEIMTMEGTSGLDRFLPQRLITEWMTNNDIPFLDLLPVLQAVPPMADGKKHCYHLQDTHFNARGNLIAGRAIAEYLADKLPQTDTHTPQSNNN